MFSIVMPSYLGPYKDAAKNRDKKIIRAVKSVLNQTFKDWELLIISDGCEQTVDIIKKNFTDKRIRLFKIKKQVLWGGTARNVGIEKATHEWIIYLDIDDLFGANHLQIVADNLKGDWVWYNDYVWNIEYNKFLEVHENIDVKGKCGTSTICHKRELKARWNKGQTYLHDWVFIRSLKNTSKDYHKIPTPEYLVCHIPKLVDV
jgi:glycosyltransferase involved in cell wall biosynthesis